MLKNSRINYAKEYSEGHIYDSENMRSDNMHSDNFRGKSPITAESPSVHKIHMKTNSKSEKSGDKKSQYKWVEDATDEEIEVSYNHNYNSPDMKNEKAHIILSRQSNSSEINLDCDAKVPPLALKNLKSSKNTQGNNTGKLTRTTMNTTQIRDKMSSNNLKYNINSGITQHKSNTDCKLVFIQR